MFLSVFLKNRVFSLFTLPLIILIFISYISVAYQDLSFEVKRKISGLRIIENNNAKIELNISNKGSAISFLEISDRLPDRVELEEGSNYILTSLKKDESITIQYMINCPIRGYYKIGPTHLRVTDCFGFFYKEKIIDNKKMLSVIPSIDDLGDIKPKSRSGIYPGFVHGKHSGIGTEFYGLREYTTTDTFKNINWKAFARWNKPMVNEYELESITSVIIILDSRINQNIGSVKNNPLEFNIKAAASIASHFLKKRDQVGLIIYGKSNGKIHWIYPESGKKQLDKIITALIETEPDGEFTLDSMTRQAIMHLIPRKGLIILLSSLEDDESIPRAIENIRARGYNLIVISPSPYDIEYSLGSYDTYSNLAYNILSLRRKNLITRIRKTGAIVVDWNPSIPLSLTLKEVEQYQIRR